MPPYIFFARHGETEADRLCYLQSQTIDEPLNKTGRTQAKKLGKRLKDQNIGLMVVSPTKRTLETANLIMDIIAPPHVADVINPDFLEINCGSLDGLFYAIIEKTLSDLFNAWWGTSAPFAKRRLSFPDGESFKQIVNRGKSAAKYLLSEISTRNQNILVIGHGNMNAVIAATLLGLDTNEFFAAIYFQNCGLIKIDRNFNGLPRLIIS
ncbi:hypothetical protein A2567_01090 [Candidatus Azambacteria bacterium RIFOXYD1_FULL_42_11]|uniref:Phosphoglycerate mutase n=4 Tax=Candidatus Azamiibacteriota TaxID=1752741 RepID=A0A0G0ZAQ6_9BACT|nr:MAG: Phosphoglycerate mutase [Candidatus Azambacteria bacterium GW2011_GWB1_42_17]KKS45729.1 MAG: Phosphoglycerate mutase [Candidatus Azambacteria bacterium GW2011_GWA1_42_19]KKS75079.1 MAG: Phosphoglycerate mutase [Candidatus Azambacteria bacterium GW2011_GWA2_42_9]KKS88624.1 MAG: Phosphoglycerate mutase [Parcubacteria group bacterium GW2011_GWC1_43_11]OGD41825.1 MAG: hypothetical protein A2567_01090 [Candidatus Azambacteria bacterium RIFOXYD1_FULL_42_11]